MANQNFKVKHGLEVGTGTTVSVDGINVTGVITATTFAGDGSALTGVTASGTGVIVQEEGSNIGTAATINFIGSNVTAALSGGIANVTVNAGGLSNVVEDTTPQLGGNLDLNSKDITGTGNISITGGFNATGVSTFQENVVFQSTASFGDNDKINVGAGNDLQIFHDGTSNIISDAVGAGISLVGNTKVVGVLTATSFSGSLATTDLTGTITNAQLAGSIADGKLASTFLKNVVEDTTPQLGGDLDGNGKQITGIGTISLDDLSVAGLSTFRNTVLLDGNTKLDFYSSTSQEGQIYATSEYFYINSSADNGVFVQTNGFIELKKGSGSDKYIEMNSHPNHNGEVSLYYDGSKKLETTNTGVTVTGTLAATAVTGSGSGLTGLTGASAGTYGASALTPIITVDSNGRITGITTVVTSGTGSGSFNNVIEDTTPQLGGNLDLNSKTINGTGNIDITGYAAVSGVSTFSGVAGFSSHITLPDYAEIQVGNATGGDLKIYHDGSNSYIQDSGTGDLRLDTNLFRVRNAAGSESMIVASNDGAVSLYHNNALRLQTTGTGVNITDDLNVAGISTFTGNVILNANLDLQDNDKILLGSGDDFEIFHDGSNSIINDGGTGNLQLQAAGTTRIEVTTSGATVTGTLAATAVTGDGSGLTGLPAAGISTANTNIQATWSVTSSGSSAYRFTGPGNDAADDNPDLYLVRGQRYRFTNNSGGSHPFQIRSSPGGSAYSTGVTNNGGASGNIDFNVQHDAPERLYYQCTSHSGMVGNIYIVGGSDWRMTSVNTSTAPEIYTTRSVGIGTDNPQEKLHVNGTSDFIVDTDAAGLRFGSHGEYDIALVTGRNTPSGSSRLYIENGNGEALRITSAGKIGVNTDTALNAGAMTLYAADEGEGTAKGQLELKDTAAFGSTPTGGIIFSGHHTAGSQAIFAGIRGFKANTSDGDYDGCLAFDVRKHGAIAYEAMRINENGSVGIGTDNPGTNLDVFEGTGTNSTKALVRFQKDHTSTSVTGATGAVDQYPHALILENQDNSANTGTVSLSFSKYSSGVQSQAIIAGIQESAGNMALTLNTESGNTMGERLRITSDGKMGLGTNSPSVSLDLASNTDALSLPTGTTAQRPSGTDAYIRKNSTNNSLEFYNGTEWVEIITDYFPTGSTILG